MKDHAHHDHELQVKKVDRLSPTRVRVTVEFTGDSVRDHRKMMLNRFIQQAKIPGFRPGKAPRQMVESKYKEDIQKEVIQHLVEAGLTEALEKTKLIPLNRPKIELGKVEEEAKPFEFHAEFEVEPEIELSKYKGVPLKESKSEVTEDEINETLHNLRERLSMMEPYESKVPEKGCFANLEVGFETVDEPIHKEPAKNAMVELGAGKLIPELDAALLELSVGAEESTAIHAKFPDDYHEKTLAGREAIFHCKLLDLKKRVLPELDDAFAERIRPGKTLDALRAEIRENIQASKDEENRRAQRTEVVDYLVANHPFEAPSSLVERQMQRLVQMMMEDLKRRGQGLPQFKDEDVAALRKRAEHMVKSSLLLKAISTKEKITLDESKFGQRIAEYSLQLQKDEAETEKLLQNAGVLDQLRDEILTDQVFAFLMENAEKVASQPTR